MPETRSGGVKENKIDTSKSRGIQTIILTIKPNNLRFFSKSSSYTPSFCENVLFFTESRWFFRSTLWKQNLFFGWIWMYFHKSHHPPLKLHKITYHERLIFNFSREKFTWVIWSVLSLSYWHLFSVSLQIKAPARFYCF